MQRDGVVLIGAHAEVHRGPTTQQGVLVMRQPALTPGPNFKAVLVLALSSGALDKVRTSPGLCQVGAVCAPVHRGGQDVSSPMLQAESAGSAAARPGGEV